MPRTYTPWYKEPSYEMKGIQTIATLLCFPTIIGWLIWPPLIALLPYWRSNHDIKPPDYIVSTWVLMLFGALSTLWYTYALDLLIYIGVQ